MRFTFCVRLVIRDRAYQLLQHQHENYALDIYQRIIASHPENTKGPLEPKIL